ncbi:MAG: hypothetical protein CMG55_07710, partial [Candidatus Marinimicrobia bacterium]|nr:hypothetical protein [Candidatus Neomarinimicrobiota bacterium]
MLTAYFLFGIHYYSSNVGGRGLYLPYNIIGWVFISILIGISFFKIYIDKQFVYSKIQILIFIGCLFLVLPIFYQNNDLQSYSIYPMVFLGGGFLFFSSLLQFNFSKIDKLNLLYIILIGIGIQSIIGIIQYYELGLENNFILQKKSRPYGSFQQVNNMASFMATGSGICLFLLNQDHLIKTFQLKRALIYTVTLFSSILIILLESNMGIIGFSLTIFFQIHKIKIKKKLFQKFLLFMISGLLIGYLSPKIIQKDFSRTMKNRINSGSIRLELYDTTFDLWKKNIISGIGYSNFSKKFREEIASRNKKREDVNPSILSQHWDHPHNEILLWVSEGGVSPIIGFIILFLSYLIIISRYKIKENLPLIAILFPIFLHNQTEFPFRVSLVHWIIFIIIIYISHNEKLLEYKIKKVKILIIIGSLIPSLCFFYMIATFQKLKILDQFEKSGMKDYELLLDINNPGPLHLKYDNYILKGLLDLGTKTNDQSALNMYLNKANNFIKRSPNPHIYKGMAQAYKSLGDKEGMENIIYESAYLFPILSTNSNWVYFALKEIGNDLKAKQLLEKLKIHDPLLYKKINNYHLLKNKILE